MPTKKAPSISQLRVSEDAPPPSYHDHSTPSLVVAETTTRTKVVTTTTTETTTQLFSPFIRRKRVGHSPTVITPHIPPSADNELDFVEPPPGLFLSSYIANKSLPPTPADDPDAHLHVKDSSELNKQEPGLLPDISPAPAMTALAQAALGISLPHVMPLASSSSSTSHSPATSSSIHQSFVDIALPSTLRKAKSSQKIRLRLPSSEVSTTESSSPVISNRRRRGLSFTTAPLLSLGGDIKNKEKGPGQSSEGSPKVLPRRSSFWIRKKSTPLTEELPFKSAESSLLSLGSLPTVQPSSPFEVDILLKDSTEDSEHPKRHHAKGLSRSFSENSTLSRLTGPRSQTHPPESATSVSTRDHSMPVPPPNSNKATMVQNVEPLSSGSHMHTVPWIQSSPVIDQSGRSNESSAPVRLRAQTNPPFLRRLSLSVLSAADRFSPNSTADNHSPLLDHNRKSEKMALLGVPKPMQDEESPEGYLVRLSAAVSKSEIAGILASSANTFHTQALRTYISQFDFIEDPLDIALRKLLMEVGLPRETQQIDRVIEAFASRYLQCNPNLFTSEDQPYILAFSLIMLHTDAFNRSNKRKMSKSDYIKNTRLPGVSVEVLDCFYDNIVFAPFIFIEDPLDVNGQRGFSTESPIGRFSTSINSPMMTASPGGTLLPRANKVDPYYLITNNLLRPLRVNVGLYISWNNPYSYLGTAQSLDDKELRRAFSGADTIKVNSNFDPTPAITVGMSDDLPTPVSNSKGSLSESRPPEVSVLKVTKIGLLNRKDELLEGGKRASSRKWRTWSVIITGSQLLFFRDPTWVSSLKSPRKSPLITESTVFRPDELLSLKDSIAVYDKTYSKYQNTLRFVMANGRQLLLQASDQTELNEWIARINYASTFKTAGVRMRPLEMSGRDVHLTGVAAATSHLRDIHQARSSGEKRRSWGSNAPRELMDMLTGEPSKERGDRLPNMTITGGKGVDLEAAALSCDADQFKMTFDEVKAQLASDECLPAGHEFYAQRESIIGESQSHELSAIQCSSGLPTRFQIIQSKIGELKSRISVTQAQLDTEMRLLRNIATLTPFQKSTRERLLTSVQIAAKRVMKFRLEYVKLTCHRDLLSLDLLSEEQSWDRTKSVALESARNTLYSHRAENVPQMTLSLHDDEGISGDPLHPLLWNTASHSTHDRPNSSPCSSFHSAIDFDIDWQCSNETPTNFLRAGSLVDSPLPSRSGSLSSVSTPPILHPASSDTVSDTQPQANTHEKSHTDEQDSEELAETWNRTRCAQRVSLVRVPSTIQMSTRFTAREISGFQRGN